MTREYMRILVTELARYEAEGWKPADRYGAVAVTSIHGGQVLVCLVWRDVP